MSYVKIYDANELLPFTDVVLLSEHNKALLEKEKFISKQAKRIAELESIHHTDNTAVIDNLQDRIKELESENKHLEDYIDAYQKSEALDIEKLDEKDERIKELREALIANDNHWLNVYKENIELKSKIRKLEGK